MTRKCPLTTLGPLPSAEAERHVRSVDVFAADDCVVVTFELDREPDCRWAIEMTLTDGRWCRWLWHNGATR